MGVSRAVRGAPATLVRHSAAAVLCVCSLLTVCVCLFC